MKKLGLFLFNVSVMAAMPAIAGAAGTYYNGNLYQNPQSRYGNGGYYNSYGAGRGYGQGMQNMGTSKQTAQRTKKTEKAAARKQGFYLDANFTHEFASWEFDMKETKSQLHYDNLSWNVLSADGVYYFGDTTPMQIGFGAKYGMQFGESPMVDDDITNGPYAYLNIAEGTEYGHAMSLGTSTGGKQTGFNVSFGLTDFFNWGRVKATPSVGYRYFKHSLKTENNYGLTMDTFAGNSSHEYINCASVGGETQCDPLVTFAFYNDNNELVGYNVTGRVQYRDENGNLLFDSNGNPLLSGIIVDTEVPSGAQGAEYVFVDLGDTYYYSQAGTSHKYETEWAGPYLALDLEYSIDNKNSVSGGIEFGLPIYDSKGDQPYRVDWAHPTSVEDKGSLGDAIHIGLNTMWSTQVSDTVNFSLGFTYDYYRVSGATAKTYLNPTYYQAVLNDYLYEYDEYAYAIANGAILTTEQQDYYEQLVADVTALEAQKNAGWTIESKNEIESVYKAMGIRAGFNVKF